MPSRSRVRFSYWRCSSSITWRPMSAAVLATFSITSLMLSRSSSGAGKAVAESEEQPDQQQGNGHIEGEHKQDQQDQQGQEVTGSSRRHTSSSLSTSTR